MKLYLRGGEVREVKVGAALAGVAVERIEMTAADFAYLQTYGSPILEKRLAEWVDKMLTRFVPG